MFFSDMAGLHLAAVSNASKESFLLHHIPFMEQVGSHKRLLASPWQMLF